MGLAFEEAKDAGWDQDERGYMDFKAQHALTAAREGAQHAWLHQKMHGCISENPLDRRGRWARAFFCTDRFSRQFLTAMPLRDTDSVFCNAEWDEAIACYMGLVSPACKGQEAKQLASSRPGSDAGPSRLRRSGR